MRRRIVLFAMLFSLALRESAAQPAFVWGTIRWKTQSPASGLKVILLGPDGAVRATTYTNPTGRYVFFESSGQPSQYSLHIYYRDTLLTTTNIPSGGRVPDLMVSR
jgi:hypothetical protein